MTHRTDYSTILTDKLSENDEIAKVQIATFVQLEQARLTSEHEIKSQKISAGWLAYVIGTDSDKSGNIVLIALIFLMLIEILIINQAKLLKDILDPKDAFLSILSAITSLLGYLFGRDVGPVTKQADRSQ